MVKRWIVCIGGLVWVAALAFGISTLVAYANTAGAVAHGAPAQWPSRSALSRTPGRPVLVTFLHPHCPCSRATVGELARLMAQAPSEKSTHAVFYKPAGAPRDWHLTDLWADASAIPGVAVAVDEAGMEMRRFGVATSGHTLLYDERGQLRFTGGITASRGHAGDNAGMKAVVSLLLQRPAKRSATSVFGCSLVEPETGVSRP